MRSYIAIPALLAFARGAFGVTLYLAGDSTMASGGGGSGTDGKLTSCLVISIQLSTVIGWGQYLAQYLTGITVVNDAIAGRSARSYTEEGRFTTIINTVAKGDYVIIEFGHNDGSAGAVDNGRQDAVGG